MASRVKMPQPSVRVAMGLETSLSQVLALRADTVRNRICPNAKELVLMTSESMQMNSLQAILAGRQTIVLPRVNHPLSIVAMPKLARPFNDILQDCFVLNLIFSVGLHLGSNPV